MRGPSSRLPAVIALAILLMLPASLVGSRVTTKGSPDPMFPGLGPNPGSLTYSLAAVANVSGPCGGSLDAEVEQAVDPAVHYIYEAWMGCGGIAFARSTDRGIQFSDPIGVPGSVGSTGNSWDPSVAVAPNGTVYVAFMRSTADFFEPVVVASFDHGLSFGQVSFLAPPEKQNWGDRDFIAVAPNGTVYLTWDYGPLRSDITYVCAAGGSCGFSTGDLNVVVQWSTDGGRHWSAIVPINPGFPFGGGDLAPLLVEPNGNIDLVYQGYTVTNNLTAALAPAHLYFTTSSNGGTTWTTPVLLGPKNLTMSVFEWWIDGAIGIDQGGTLYATWDTQNATADVAWLVFSTDHGRTWSHVYRVTPDSDTLPHIVEVVGGVPGRAYVGWLSDNASGGYAQYLRLFSTFSGFRTPPIRVSSGFGDPAIWPGDTFGISLLSNSRVELSWGSATSTKNHPKSEIFATSIVFQ